MSSLTAAGSDADEPETPENSDERRVRRGATVHEEEEPPVGRMRRGATLGTPTTPRGAFLGAPVDADEDEEEPVLQSRPRRGATLGTPRTPRGLPPPMPDDADDRGRAASDGPPRPRVAFAEPQDP